MVKLSEFAKEMGISSRAAQKAAKSGRISSEKKGRYYYVNLKKAKKEFESTKGEISSNPSGKKKSEKSKQKLEPVEPPKYEGLTTADADRQERVYKARLAQLKYEEQSGQLIKADEVKKRAFEVARKVRDSILSVPSRVAHELAAETDPHTVEIKLNKFLVESLERVSQDI